MGNKFIDYLTIAIIIFAVLAIVWFIVTPLIWWNESRFYLRIFLVMFGVQTFAILRLYNAIVQNTRFSLKLRESMIKFSGVILGIERSLKTLNNTMTNLRSSLESTKSELSDNTDKLDKLKEKIQRLNGHK